MSGESYIDDAALQQHAKQRVLEEATLHLLKRFSILLKRYSKWYQDAVTTICARARHTKRMSAMGHKQTFALYQPMSAFHPKADMCGATRDVRFGPIADIFRSLDHFIGAGEYGRWNREAQCFRSL